MATNITPVIVSTTTGEDFDNNVPVDWENVSVKEEPVDLPVGTPQQHLATATPDVEDSKENITGNFCVGELHYLPAETKSEPCTEGVPDQSLGNVGETLPCGVNIPGNTGEASNLNGGTAGEQNVVGFDCLDFLPLKEEEDEIQEPAVSAAGPANLSYIDNFRLYMSPRDREIDAQWTPTANGVPVTDGQIISPQTGPTKSKSKVSSAKKSPKSKQQHSTIPSTAVHSQSKNQGSKPVSKKSKVLYRQYEGASNRELLEKQEKGNQVSKKKDLCKMPCVVQLCEMTNCGVDCSCTVKAPYPKKLKAVTLSTQMNIKSLSSEYEYSILRKLFNTENESRGKQKQVENDGTDDIPYITSNFITGRIGAGKRQTKLSEKLRSFVEERQKHRLSQLKAKRLKQGIKNNSPLKVKILKQDGKDKFLCPVCDHVFSFKHTLKQHMKGHRLGLSEQTAEDLSIEFPPDQVQSDLPDVQKLQMEMSNHVPQNALDESIPSSVEDNENEPMRPSNGSRYQALRNLLTAGTSTTPLSPGSNDRSEAHTKDSPEREKSLKIVLKIPQFKARSSPELGSTPKSKKKLEAKKSDKKPNGKKKSHEEKMTRAVVVGSLGVAEVVSFESGKKVSEASVNVQAMPDGQNQIPILTNNAEQPPSLSQCTTDSANLPEAMSNNQDLDNPSHYIVIAPINDFSPQVQLNDNINESNMLPEPEIYEARGEPAQQSSTQQDIPERSRRSVKRKLTYDEEANPGAKRKKKGSVSKMAEADSVIHSQTTEPPTHKSSLQKEFAVITIAPVETRASKRKSSPEVSVASIKKSPKAKCKTKASPSDKDSHLNVSNPEELSAHLLERINNISPPRLPSDDDSDATDAYGEDDDRDSDFSPIEPKPSKKKQIKPLCARKSTGGTRWHASMKTKQSQKLKEKSLMTVRAKESLRRGRKRQSQNLEEEKDEDCQQIDKADVSKQNAKTSPKVSRKQQKASGKKEAGLKDKDKSPVESDDGDSGVDFESDGSDQKQMVKKVRHKINPDHKFLQMQSGELVSTKEVWACVQSRLDNRTEKKPVQCPICDKPFPFPSALKRHVMMHTNEKEFQCPHCPKAFSRKPHLTEHIRVHTGERPFKCSHCPAAFAQRTNLLIHNRTHTGSRPFKCPECGKRFRRQDAHTQHILTHHSNVKPYICAECRAAFPCARYLKDHLRVHSKERPFKCDRCSSAFVCRKYLLLHVRALHLNERPFKCKECPAKFAQSGKLTEHMRVHTGERPYKCSTCGTSFSRSGHLRRHLLIHTGARPYACKVCDAKFSQQDHLKRHMSNIHKQ